MLMWHPALKRAHWFQPEQVPVMRKSGWVDMPTAKRRAASSTVSDQKEPSDG